MEENFLLESLEREDVDRALDFLLQYGDENKKVFRSKYVLYKKQRIGVKIICFVAIGIKEKWDLSCSDIKSLQSQLIALIKHRQNGWYFHTNRALDKLDNLGITYSL